MTAQKRWRVVFVRHVFYPGGEQVGLSFILLFIEMRCNWTVKTFSET